MNKYKINFEKARDTADEYLEYLENHIYKLINENAFEKLEVILLDMTSNTSIEDKLLEDCHRMLSAEEYQSYATQKLIYNVYLEYKTKVLPGNDFDPVYNYLDYMDENTFIENIENDIDRYKFQY